MSNVTPWGRLGKENLLVERLFPSRLATADDAPAGDDDLVFDEVAEGWDRPQALRGWRQNVVRAMRARVATSIALQCVATATTVRSARHATREYSFATSQDCMDTPRLTEFVTVFDDGYVLESDEGTERRCFLPDDKVLWFDGPIGELILLDGAGLDAGMWNSTWRITTKEGDR